MAHILGRSSKLRVLRPRARQCTLRFVALAVVLVCLWPAVSAADASRATSRSTGQWLVDRIRTLALTDRLKPEAADAEYALVWMEAAARLSPECPDAHLWQFDLLHRVDRPAEAMTTLEAYCRLVPDDVAARLNLISLGFEECQTVDARIAFCRGQLDKPDLPPEVVSDLHRRLADLHCRSGDRDAAREHARLAVDAFGHNLQAKSVLFELDNQKDDPVERTRLLLDAVAANPAHAGSVLELARFLDSLSLHDAARSFYQHAIGDFKRCNPEGQPPPDMLLSLARSDCDAGRYESALSTCGQIVEAYPSFLDAKMLGIRIARLQGAAEDAKQSCDTLGEQLAELEPGVLANRDAETAARLAWFHIEFKPEPASARRLAQVAVDNAPDEPAFRRVLGWAELLDGDALSAQQTLAPLASDDQLAAIGLAQALLDQGRQADAIAALRKAESLAYSGFAHRKLASMLRKLEEDPAPKPDRRKVRQVLDGFNKDVLRFHADPSRVLQLDVALPRRKLRYGEPWTCTLTLTNKGTYPITLGQGGMIVNPEVLVSAAAAWSHGPRFDNYLSISLMRRNVLLPGERIVVSDRVDIGPLGELLWRDPQRQVFVSFSFLLDPVPSPGGEWTSRLNMNVAAIRVTRETVDAAPRGLKRIITATRSKSESQRIAAIHALGGLIAERRRSGLLRLSYTAFTVDDAALLDEVLARLRDPSAIVRAHALGVLHALELDKARVRTDMFLGIQGLRPETQTQAIEALSMLDTDEAVTGAVAPLLSDANWLVRLYAVELLALRQGAVFDPVASRLAEVDADPLVKKLSSLYHEDWKTHPTTQPATPEAD